MSKTSKHAIRAMDSDFQSKQEVLGHASFALAGKRTITNDEARKLMGEAADQLDVNFTRLHMNMNALTEAELAVSDSTRLFITRAKNLAAQVGDSMARIDKLVVKDFEVKLCQLERFVEALKALDDLHKSGRLNVLMTSFSK